MECLTPEVISGLVAGVVISIGIIGFFAYLIVDRIKD